VLRSNAAEERRVLEQRIRAEVENQIEEREPTSSKGSVQYTDRDRERGEGKMGIERGDRGDRDRENDIDYAGQEERDKRLQAEIRQLQLETVRTYAPLGTWKSNNLHYFMC
jgi:hypothetical protein